MCARMAEEIYSLPRRIRAMHRLNAILRGPGYGLPMPAGTTHYLDVLHACKRDIEELSAANPWMTSLDLEMASQGWAKGFESALRKSRETA